MKIARCDMLPGSAVSVSGVLRCARDTGKARGTCVPRAFGEVWLRRCATLPCPLGHSTIAVPGLSFRVRNGTGRAPHALAADRWAAPTVLGVRVSHLRALGAAWRIGGVDSGASSCPDRAWSARSRGPRGAVPEELGRLVRLG